MKKIIYISLIISITHLSYAQSGSFRVKGSSPSINIGFNNYYRYLTFGTGNNGSQDGPFAIEYWNGGLNFWKPYPNANNGNYFLFLQDDGLVGIRMKPNNLTSTNLPQNVDALHVKGFIVSNGTRITSDLSLKRNITPLQVGLVELMRLRPVEYYYRENMTRTGTSCDSNAVKNATINADIERMNPADNSVRALRYGLIAQSVDSIFPNLIDNVGQYLSLNYTELIPVLIRSIQEQQKIIDTQNLRITQLRQEIENWKGSSIDTTQSKTRLFQNTPNPFDGTTVIPYYIDENSITTNAVIEIRNIMGNLITSLSLGDQSGLGEVSFNGSNLNQGYYIYTLKINGSVKDSKMFLKEN